MAAHGHYVLMFRVQLGQTLAQATHEGIDGLLGNCAVGSIRPYRPHDVVAADNRRTGIHQLKQPILLRRQRGFDQFAIDQYLMCGRVYVQTTGLRVLKNERRGRSRIHEGQLIAQRDLDFIAIVQPLGTDYVSPIEMCPVLAVQILYFLVVFVPRNTGVQPGYLAVIQDDVAFRAAANHDRATFKRPGLTGIGPTLEHKHG